MQAPVNIGIVFAVIIVQGFDDPKGFLGGGGVIQINQLFPMDLFLEDRKILADFFHIQKSDFRFYLFVEGVSLFSCLSLHPFPDHPANRGLR